jgi:hypothetical protein
MWIRVRDCLAALDERSKGHLMAKQARFNEVDRMPALGICESLLIALTELKIISEKNARSLLIDVATKHNRATFVRILTGKNGVRH